MFQGLEFTQHPTGSLPRSLGKSTMLTILFLLLLMFRILHVSIMRTGEREWTRGTRVTPLSPAWHLFPLSGIGFPHFPEGASGKEPPCQCRRCKRFGFSLWVRKLPGGGHGNHSSILAWRISWTEELVAMVHRVTKSHS